MVRYLLLRTYVCAIFDIFAMLCEAGFRSMQFSDVLCGLSDDDQRIMFRPFARATGPRCSGACAVAFVSPPFLLLLF